MCVSALDVTCTCTCMCERQLFLSDAGTCIYIVCLILWLLELSIRKDVCVYVESQIVLFVFLPVTGVFTFQSLIV